MNEKQIDEKYVDDLGGKLKGWLEDAKSYVKDALDCASYIYADPYYYAKKPDKLEEELKSIRFYTEEAILMLEKVVTVVEKSLS